MAERWKVTVSERGVRFSIDHQTFTLHVENDPETPLLVRQRWFARQLRIALKRLAAPSKEESNG